MSRKPPVPASGLSKAASSPALTLKRVREERKATARLVRRLSEDTSPMSPDYVTLDVTDNTGEEVKKRVYVTEVNGTRSLDLYSGWNPERGEHKFPLKVLPSKVCALANLQRLWVSHNHLSSLPTELDRLVHLKELFLHRNNFEDFPIPVCTLRSLEVLWLSCNKIMKIPNEISQLKTLKRLHLDTNYINELTAAVCELTDLEVLYLNENTLHIVSEDIGNLKSLKRLYLQQNKISDIPSGICQLTSLKMFMLNNNDIRHIPSDFKMFQYSLESKGAKVSLHDNPFMWTTPQNKGKLSLTTLHHTHLTLNVRRHSDQFDQDLVTRRPARVSLPGTRASDSMPTDLHGLQYPMYNTEYKADTLPRSSTVAVMQKKGNYHEH